MRTIGLNDIKTVMGNAEIIGNNMATATHASSIDRADKNSIIWIKPDRLNKEEIINLTQASIIIVDTLVNKNKVELKNKCLIIADSPKLIFLRIVSEFLISKISYGIHESAIISPKAEIHKETYIGPNSFIGNSKVGKGSVIHGSCFIYDNVIIGENVRIQAGTVIGSEGFGYSRNEIGEFELFPHIGGVIIEDNVDIGANTCIDRGTLGDTIIKKGAKIDNLVHIAHNVIVGKHSAIIANAMIAGSVVIGDYTWVAPSAAILNQLHIGENSTIGLGSVVMKSIPDNEVWTGHPAMPLKKFVEVQKKIKKL